MKTKRWEWNTPPILWSCCFRVLLCRFEDSEYALHEQIKKCSVFATESKVYPTLVKLDFIGTLSYLLVHDNIVISTDVIKLLYIFLSPISSLETT